MAPKPTTVTIYGRLSFPTWDYKTAVINNQRGPNPAADVSKVTPEFNLLVEQHQLDKLINKIRDEFLPHCIQINTESGGKKGLTKKQVDKLLAQLDEADWTDQPPYIPIKQVSDKSLALMPEAVASIKVKGQQGQDLILKAVVKDETELEVPDPNILSYPIVKPIGQTVHTMYPGCIVAATLNLYSFANGALPGYSAAASTAVFKDDAQSFSGGVDVDEDEIFMDD